MVVLIYSYLFESTREKAQAELVARNKQLQTNIMDLHSSDAKLDESERKYRILVERANDGICLIQGDKLVFVNQRLAEIFGYSPAQMMKISFFECIHPRERATIENRSAAKKRGESVPSRFETVLRHRDGSPDEVKSGVKISAA